MSLFHIKASPPQLRSDKKGTYSVMEWGCEVWFSSFPYLTWDFIHLGFYLYGAMGSPWTGFLLALPNLVKDNSVVLVVQVKSFKLSLIPIFVPCPESNSSANPSKYYHTGPFLASSTLGLIATIFCLHSFTSFLPVLQPSTSKVNLYIVPGGILLM